MKPVTRLRSNAPLDLNLNECNIFVDAIDCLGQAICLCCVELAEHNTNAVAALRKIAIETVPFCFCSLGDLFTLSIQSSDRPSVYTIKRTE